MNRTVFSGEYSVPSNKQVPALVGGKRARVECIHHVRASMAFNVYIAKAIALLDNGTLCADNEGEFKSKCSAAAKLVMLLLVGKEKSVTTTYSADQLTKARMDFVYLKVYMGDLHTISRSLKDQGLKGDTRQDFVTWEWTMATNLEKAAKCMLEPIHREAIYEGFDGESIHDANLKTICELVGQGVSQSEDRLYVTCHRARYLAAFCRIIFPRETRQRIDCFFQYCLAILSRITDEPTWPKHLTDDQHVRPHFFDTAVPLSDLEGNLKLLWAELKACRRFNGSGLAVQLKRIKDCLDRMPRNKLRRDLPSRKKPSIARRASS